MWQAGPSPAIMTTHVTPFSVGELYVMLSLGYEKKEQDIKTHVRKQSKG